MENLVLGHNEKRLLSGIIACQKPDQTTFDDFVEGKGKRALQRLLASAQDTLTQRAGKGVVILLSGPPGVGKTLTAECGKRH